MGEIHVPGVVVKERAILPAELEAADEVFITSTTRDLLPVAEVEGRPVGRADSARKALQAAFSEYMKGYLAERRAVTK